MPLLVPELGSTLVTFGFGGGAGGVTGTIAAQEAADSFAASGANIVTSALALQDAADAWAVSGNSTVAGALALLEGADVFAAGVATAAVGDLAIVEFADVWSISGVGFIPPTPQPSGGGTGEKKRGPQGRAGTGKIRYAGELGLSRDTTYQLEPDKALPKKKAAPEKKVTPESPQELRAKLSAAQDEIAALQAEIEELRQQNEVLEHNERALKVLLTVM